MRDVVLLSGGLDSTVLAHTYSLRDEVIGLSVDYGQRHRRELVAAAQVAERLGIEHQTVDLSGLRSVLSGSALTDDVDVPEGHYAAESMRATVVPNRNAVLLSVAVGLAVARGADRVAAAVHAGDHPIYPDCRPEFIAMFDAAAQLGTAGHAVDGFHVAAPFVDKTKTEIVHLGAQLGTPFELTWSCYAGGDVHCGRCGTCVERAESFADAGVDDPTEYEAR